VCAPVMNAGGRMERTARDLPPTMSLPELTLRLRLLRGSQQYFADK